MTPRIWAPPLVFFANGLIYMSLISRLPDVTARAGIGAGQLGLAMAAVPAGVLLALLVLPRLSARFAAETIARVALCLSLAIAALTGWVGLYGLAALLLAFGFAREVLELAQNQLARAAELRSGRGGMALAHGGWSVGALVATGLASLLIAGQVPVALHLLLVGIPAIVLAFATLGRGARPAPLAVSPGFPRPDRYTVLLFCVSLGFMATENMVYAWGLFYLREEAGFSPATATLVYSAFAAAMILMRLTGDRLRDRVARRPLLAVMAVLVLCGLALLLVAAPLAGRGQWGVAIAGLALAGAGVALNAPILARAALDHGAASSFAALSGLNLAAGMALPVLYGGLAATLGYWACFAASAPLILFSAIAARRLPD
ncbi:MFS transporter [Oceanicola sp. S124]|uniref:MFS transporter n=1 Tax=Oceanicola sp. S124 TaxID=1042378 RepID=UPI0002558918|nr:MFS transporter [Oceanicola sp. S124]